MLYKTDYPKRYLNNTNTCSNSLSFKSKPNKKLVGQISENSLKLASAAIAAMSISGIELSKSDKTDILDTVKTLYSVKEPVKNNLKKYIDRNVYINARENLLLSEDNFNSYIDRITQGLLKNYKELDNIRQQYIKEIIKEVILERLENKDLPLDFSDISELKPYEQKTKFMNLFFSKEIFEKFINKNMNTKEIQKFLYAGYGTVILRLNEYELQTEQSIIRHELANPELDKKILELHKKELNQREIAQELGLKTSFIQEAFVRLKIKTKKQEQAELAAKPETIEKIIQLRKDGMTLEQIAKTISISRTTVREILKNNGVKSHFEEVRTEEFIQKIEDLYDKGYNLSQIEEELGCSADYAGTVLKDKGKFTKNQQNRKNYAEKRPLVINTFNKETKDINLIAKKYGLDWKQTYQILVDAHLIIPKSNKQKEGDKKVLEVYKQNHSIKSTAEVVGKSTDYVYKALLRNGIKTEIAKRNEHLNEEKFKQRILNLFKEGYSAVEIAELMTCSSRKVRDILNDNGQKTKKQLIIEYRHSKELRDNIIKQFNNNIPIYKICQNTKKEFSFVARILENENLLNNFQQKRRMLKTEETENELRMLFRNGCTIKQISEFSGVSRCTIQRKLRSLGLLSKRQKYSEYLNKTLLPAINHRIELNQNYEDIANDLGISLIRLYRIIKKYNPVSLPDVSYEEYTDDELKAKINNIFFENEKLFDDESIIEVFDFIESQKNYNNEQKIKIINLIKECEKLMYNKITSDSFINSTSMTEVLDWMDSIKTEEQSKIDEFETLIFDLNNALANIKSNYVKQLIIKYMPYSINDKNNDNAKIIRNVIKETPNQKAAEYKLLYLEERKNPNKLFHQAELYAEDENHDIDMIKAGQYIHCYNIMLNNFSDKNSVKEYPEVFINIIKQSRVSDKYKMEYMIGLDNWNNLDYNEKSKLSVFKNIFNQETDISKDFIDKYLENIYQNTDTKYIAVRENGGKENVTLAAGAKQGILGQYGVGKNAINMILKFENAMTRIVGSDGESGIKYLDNLGFYEVKIPRPHIDRLVPKTRQGFYFDEYMPRGFHKG